MDMSDRPPSPPPGSRIQEPWGNRFDRMVISSMVMLILTTAFTIMRIVSRRLSKRGFLWEDYIYLIGQLWFYGVASCAIALIAVGPPSSPSILAFKYRIMLPFRLSYAMVLLCVKLSIILIVRRIFAKSSRFVQIACWVALAVSVAWAVYASLIEFLICMPVESAWNPDLVKYNCINHHLAYGIIPAWDIPLEIFILLIPVKSILGLQMARPHKIALLCMFCAGIITISCSAIYLYFIVANFHLSYMVSIIHSGIALMVASSTALQPLFNRTILQWYRTMTQGISTGRSGRFRSGDNSNIALNDMANGRKRQSRLRDQGGTESEENLAPEAGFSGPKDDATSNFTEREREVA
ncbi:hypothetical protein S7711_08609 [Stachybotrys chartarum IBT 7711]|uniref:Rhodopsin domain-containing protein n=1 Tax=Stachybotrys chartarum (strain CBS 109288 / IBT 7711) TaxID=1280523 RepID=A0A084AWZ7_STACB|nr:hypothetical protein S7711_08609 [Stachybotrys chartarum IBT 7711]KFA49385.1 hypothetical protein S40293_09632 [Stachybotrys chartarum IBT 40293]KFA73470.1 hypothetical protein S40288_08200 [Stachybotrys chartarum IBT 40288]